MDTIQIYPSVPKAIKRYFRQMNYRQARFAAGDWWFNVENASKEYPRREDFQDAVFAYLTSQY